MARIVTPLTSTQIKNAKPKLKKYKLFDGGGLFLMIMPNGSKYWKLSYRLQGKSREYSIGVYPDISLVGAREERERMRKLVATGVDISSYKKNKKIESMKEYETQNNSFHTVAILWWNSYKSEVSERYHNKLLRTLELHVFPYFKQKAIHEISRLDIINAISILKEKRFLETANKTLIILHKIFMYAVTYEYVPHNIIADIDKKTIIGKQTKRNYPTFTTNKDIRALLLSIDDYSGDYSTKKALQFLPYVFVRSYNIRHCEWSEIDLKDCIWSIPAIKMKTKTDFVLPLPMQAVNILKTMQEFRGDEKYVFPSFRSKDRPMSDNTLISAIRRMGYTKDEFVPHGFRAMFSTIAYEYANIDGGHGCTGEVIEALLAHKETNKVKGAYNRAQYVEPMRKLIQWYANYLDRIKFE